MPGLRFRLGASDLFHDPVLDGAIRAPECERVRIALAALAALGLIVIGTAESAESVRQLAELPGRGRPMLGVGGAALSGAGFALSVAIYFALGWAVARQSTSERAAVWTAVAVGIAAGLIGGTIRALLVRDYLDERVSGFGLPLDLVTWSLVIFVALAILASSAGGGLVSWLGFRFGRRRSPRPLA
jgi:hypothetical protein